MDEIEAPKRQTSLDAVRGIAACIVVAGHFYFTVPDQWREQIDGSPWSILLQPFHNGDAAVVIFFLLSGYVLALPYLRGTHLPYPHYVIRRMCRIYIPFAVAILFSLLLFSLTSRQRVAGVSEWFNTLWPSASPGFPTLAGHFLMLGTAPDITLNTPMWTLVYELRISLVFPLLMILCRDTRVAMLASLVLLMASVMTLAALGQNNHPSQAASAWITVLWTAEIAPYFVTGLLLSKHRGEIGAWWRRLPKSVRICLFAAPFAIFSVRPSFAYLRNDVLYDIGAAILIVSAVESRTLRAFLDTPIPQWLGRISYSIYLIHLPVMLAVIPLLIGHMPPGLIVVAVTAVALAAATLMHALIEAPAIELGLRLTRRAIPYTDSSSCAGRSARVRP